MSGKDQKVTLKSKKLYIRRLSESPVRWSAYFLLKGGISMELKSIIGIGAVVIILGGLVFLFIRNRRK